MNKLVLALILLIGQTAKLSDLASGCGIPQTQHASSQPMDVPAVQVQRKEKCGVNIANDGYACAFTYWTCSDKSRILLTSEDGTRHCVKFSQDLTAGQETKAQ